MLHGQTRYNMASRFFREMPEALLQRVNHTRQAPASLCAAGPAGLRSGGARGTRGRVDGAVAADARVAVAHRPERHPSQVRRRRHRQCRGRGADARVQVNFQRRRDEMAGARVRQAGARLINRLLRNGVSNVAVSAAGSVTCSGRCPCSSRRSSRPARAAARQSEHQRDRREYPQQQHQPRRRPETAACCASTRRTRASARRSGVMSSKHDQQRREPDRHHQRHEHRHAEQRRPQRPGRAAPARASASVSPVCWRDQRVGQRRAAAMPTDDAIGDDVADQRDAADR